jgi:ubiquitin carboxyl-terminal hydrolase 7
LKRYKYNINQGGFEKINDSFEFFDTLDMSQWVIESERFKSHKYQLFAVLVHRGELIHHGHYYCFIRTSN